jgi:hypothetical protein
MGYPAIVMQYGAAENETPSPPALCDRHVGKSFARMRKFSGKTAITRRKNVRQKNAPA